MDTATDIMFHNLKYNEFETTGAIAKGGANGAGADDETAASTSRNSLVLDNKTYFT